MASPAIIMPAMATPQLRRDEHDSEAARFVRAFAGFWDRPTDAGFRALMHPDVRLVQPMAPPAHGIDAACAWFAATQALLPDLRIEVTRWSGTPEALFIEWVGRATFQGRPVRWQAVDRFRVEGGTARERVAYFDPLPLLGVIARAPSGWARVVRSLWGQRRRARAA